MQDPQPGTGGPGSPARGAAPVPGREAGEEPPPSAPPGPGPGTAPPARDGGRAGPGAPPAKARKQRFLSPVWEEEPGPGPEERVPDLLQHVSLRPGGRSPEPPLFHSFFAEECRAIVRQLRLAGPELSAIEAEPLPLESAPVTPLSPGRPAQARPPRLEVRPGSPGPPDGAVSSLQVPAGRALNLTVELQGSPRASLSFALASPEPGARGLGATVLLAAETAPLAEEESGLRGPEGDELERSASAYRTHDVSSESAVSLGSGSFATSTPLLEPAKFRFLTGSPIGDDDWTQEDPSSSRRPVPSVLPCQRQADSRSAAGKVSQSSVSECRNLPEEETCGKVPPRPPQRSAALPVPSRNGVSNKDKAAVRSLPQGSAIPTARRSLALPSSESSGAAKEILRVCLPPKGRGIATERKARLSLYNTRPSLQKMGVPEEMTGRPGSSLATQPASQTPGSGPARQSGTKLTCPEKGPSALQPPSRLSALSSRPVLMRTRLSLGQVVLGGGGSSSRGPVAPGTKPLTYPGTRLRLVKPGASSLQHSRETPQPVLSLPTGNMGARHSPQERERESASKPGCNKLPIRRAASTVMHARLRPAGRTAASPRRLPSPKRARLDTNSAAPVPALETSGTEGLSADMESKPGPAVVQDLRSVGEMAQPLRCGDPPAPLSSSPPDSSLESGGAVPDVQLPGQLLSQELQKAKMELQRVKNELAARDAQCEAYRRTISSQQCLISSLEAQLRAVASLDPLPPGSRSEE